MRKTVIAAVTLAGLALAGAASAETRPRLEPVDCTKLTILAPGVTAECGYLRVPEDRANPKSRTIGVPFVIVPSASRADPDPIVMFTGGPGGRVIPRTVRANDTSRDRIFFEQRGAALAEGPLECPGYGEERQRAQRGEIDGETLGRNLTAIARRCVAEARRKGVSLGGYTSLAIVQDLEDFRALKGYERLNLIGLSYSGRVVSEYARDFPQHTRAVVANTPMTVEQDYDSYGSSAMRDTLDKVFAACAADVACSRANPDLPGKFRSLIVQAAVRPWTLELPDPDARGQTRTVVATRWVVANAILDQLYSPDTFETLPARITAMAGGDRKALADILDIGRSSYPWLMRIAIWCNEEAPFNDEAAARRQVTSFPEFGGVDQSTVPPGLCRAAGFNAHPPAAENQPVRSDVPFLILSGGFDPATPPIIQARMARTLPQATLALLPAQGHGAGYSPCGGKLVEAFIANPTAPLDLACLADKTSPDVLRGLSRQAAGG